MIVLENPFAFLLLLFIPLYYLLRKAKLFTKTLLPLTLGDWNGKGFEWKSTSFSILRCLSRLFFIVAYIFFIIALSNPIKIHQEKVYSSRSSEVVFVVDTSPSMAAIDIANGTRLEAAKKAIELIVKDNSGAAYGLVTCATEAALLVPPTMDNATLFNRLHSIQIGELGDKTSLGLGISTAVYHLVSSYAPKKTIVLLTDGESNSGSVHPNTAANLAKDYGIVLYIAGIGTKGSVPINYTNPNTGKEYSGFLDSSFDSSSLRNLAKITHGKYFTVENLPALSNALEIVSEESSTAQSYHIKQTEEPLYSSFLLYCVLFFCFTWIIRRLVLQEVL